MQDDANVAERVRLERANGDALDFDVLFGTEGASAFNIGSLLAESGLVTLDIGFANTASCSSSITYIDGDAGIVRYRGYPVDQLAEHATFSDVVHLLTAGELPTQGQVGSLNAGIAEGAELARGLHPVFAALPADTHPMAMLSAGVSALSGISPDAFDAFDDSRADTATARLIGAFAILAALTYKASQGGTLPKSASAAPSYAGDFLANVFGSPGNAYASDPVIERALDVAFILHADHEQNCSTSAVRLAGSARASLLNSVVAGISALSGPLHGGANQAVVEMLEEIRGTGGDVARFVGRVKDRQSGARLMGFGHRVYKSYDPRAAIIKRTLDQVLSQLGKKDDLLEIAIELESVALSDDYFISRKLYPNVDFYTGLLYRAIGFPANMFTVLFAVGRLPGWIAHWRECVTDKQTKIGRPRQLYTGPTARDVSATLGAGVN
jgi:citrate synthase